MNYGLYLSASGVLTNMHRTDVHSNNLANVSTAAFKPDFAILRQRAPERIESNLMEMPSQELLERLGGGTLVDPTRSNLSQGELDLTENPLDLAIEGAGFFVVDTGRGEGDARLRLSRDGRLTVDAQRRLVRSTDGLPVLSTAGAPIVVDPGATLSIDANGAVSQNNERIATIRLVDVPDDRSLAKDGSGMFRFAGPIVQLPASASSYVRQGMVERSGVDPIKAMLAVNRSSGAVQRNARMIEIQDQVLRGAINNLGRIA